MVMSIWDSIVELVGEAEKFIVANYDEPFLWITIFCVLLAIAYFAISNLANK